MENETIQNNDTTPEGTTGTGTNETTVPTGEGGLESAVPQHSFEITNTTTGEVSTGTIDFTGITSEQGELILEKLDTLINQTVPPTQQTVEVAGGVMTAEQGQMIIEGLNNLASGVQLLMYIGVAFLLWQVIKIVYNLFAGVFLGGL